MIDQLTGPPEVTQPAAHGLLFPEDRRRPGRKEVKPELVPLLRSDEIMKTAPHDDDQNSVRDDRDCLRTPRGIGLSLLLATPFWAGVGALLWWWFED